MSNPSKILFNIASNWAGFAVNAAVTLLLTPFVLHQIGEARYGVWVLTSSIIGYYGLLDFGFRGGVNQYLTRYISVRDYGKASECMSTAVVALSTLGFFLVTLSIAVAFLAPYIFDIPLDMRREAFWCILIIGFTSALQCAFFPFGSVFTATQRFDLANLIGMGTRLLMAAGIYVALRMGEGLVGISIVTCAASIVDYFIRWLVARRIAPEVAVSWKQKRLSSLREISVFGIWNFLMSVSAYASLHMQTLLIGAFMPIAAVAQFALASGLAGQIKDVLNPIGQVLYPVAVELHARGERDGLGCFYRDGGRLMMLAVFSTVLLAGFWAEDFFRLWIGDKFLTGDPFPSVALLLQILLISIVALYSSTIGSQILLGSGQVRILAIFVICETGFNLIMSLILISVYGLIGVAVSNVLSTVIGRMVIFPFLLQRRLGLPFKDYLRGFLGRPAFVSVLLVILILGIRLTGTAGDWFHLILHGVLFAVGAVVVVLGVGVTSNERDRFIWQPMRRILGRDNLSALRVKTAKEPGRGNPA